jgi:hypothetical protein
MSIPAATQVLYRELVTPKWTSFLPVTLVLPTFWLTLAPINPLLGIVSGTLVTLGTVALMLASSPVIEIKTDQLRVGKARIDPRLVGLAEAAPDGVRLAQRVPNLDPRAFLALQNSRKGLIKLQILDKRDPTPYWVFSCKDPNGVIQAINAARKTN